MSWTILVVMGESNSFLPAASNVCIRFPIPLFWGVYRWPWRNSIFWSVGEWLFSLMVFRALKAQHQSIGRSCHGWGWGQVPSLLPPPLLLPMRCHPRLPLFDTNVAIPSASWGSPRWKNEKKAMSVSGLLQIIQQPGYVLEVKWRHPFWASAGELSLPHNLM